MEEKKRLKRFIRDTKAFPAFKVQPRDLEILKSLADYRFLNTLQIKALHPGGDRNLKRRFQKLFHAGFIDRPPQQLSYVKPQGHMIYALGNKGATLLQEEAGIEKSKMDWTVKNREAKERYILHTMMISSFRVVLTVALQNHKAGVVDWQQGGDLKDYVKLDRENVAVVPDAFFSIEDPDGIMYFFLEADRGTMTTGRYLQKVRAYWQWWKDGGHARRFKIKNFRVLTVCKTEGRKENLRRITKLADDQKAGSGMFWFASEEKYCLEDPQSVLKPIWQTPKDNSYHHLLE